MSPTTQNLHSHAPELKDAVKDSRDTLKREGSRFADEMRDVGRTFAEQQKDEAARYVDDLVGAAESSAEHLQKQGRASSARFLHGTAEQIGDWAEELRHRESGELFHEVEDFARERPLLFFGAAFAIGFAAARFLRSTPDDGGRSAGGPAYRPAGMGAD